MITGITGNFRGLSKGWLVKVLEGDGTEEDPARIVTYVYDEMGTKIGEIGGFESWTERDSKK